jgi:hypothetical protein
VEQQPKPPQAAANRYSFIVRIWRAAGRPGWRGSVQQVSSGQTNAFDSLDELLAFLERQIDRLTDPDQKTLA